MERNPLQMFLVKEFGNNQIRMAIDEEYLYQDTKHIVPQFLITMRYSQAGNRGIVAAKESDYYSYFERLVERQVFC